ncbi:hypothetical protein DFH08DRAFT_882133 [Mycena albidolilacea]|uniref:Uncharacterized protein n=1 Tax=Mycena albidolilacea TaxID=1033008 RepID=A0AAD7EJK4_9AGAR|nr:hypothetical protein DFH08DRAFT_882133 [Mycena albidolilacea]
MPGPPALPIELERTIFEIAAVSWPRLVPKFMLVAWRVKTWLELLLYRTLLVYEGEQFDRISHPSIECGTLTALIHAKPPEFFRDSVRNLWLVTASDSKHATTLGACSAIENLWLGAHSSSSLLDLDLRLKRLQCTLQSIFGHSAINFTHPFFSSITHLEIFDVTTDMEVEPWSALTSLPHLTHLAFNSANYLPLCLALLSRWDTLRALVILLAGNIDPGEKIMESYGVPELIQEPRLVVVVCVGYREDWVKGAVTGHDYWSQAEDFISKRKSREIDPLEYYIPEIDEADDDGEEDSEDE